MTDYNYEEFAAKDYDLDQFSGPKPGSKAPDFALGTPEGGTRTLLDFSADFLVLELGSLTCPLFQSRRTAMAKSAAQFPNAEFVVLYVREAHPGSAIPAHVDAAAKQACAQTLKTKDGEGRRILVDNLAGDAHQAYGGYPNSVFIINKSGCVLYRSDWNNPTSTARALADLAAGRSVRSDAYFRPPRPDIAVATLRRSGRGAVADFLHGLPRLIWKNLIKRNLRLLFGRHISVGADARC